ncbi:NADPH-dependent FMN reductase [Streptomyces sp. NPDC054770]
MISLRTSTARGPRRGSTAVSGRAAQPALGQCEHEHTRRWSRTASGYDGSLLVFPQYSWGDPAVLKNALGFLYAEWRDKPASVASCGNRVAAQLRRVLQGLHMHTIDQNLKLVVTDEDKDEQLTDVAATLQPFTEQVRLVDAQLTELLTDDQQ